MCAAMPATSTTGQDEGRGRLVFSDVVPYIQALWENADEAP